MIDGIGVDTSEAAVKVLVAERNKDPKYREQILGELIEDRMWHKAHSDLCNEDYRVRLEYWSNKDGNRSTATIKETSSCFCSKIKKLFSAEL